VVNTTSAVVGGITYSGFSGTLATSTVSVGDAGLERTITNVAAGRIAASSTDAINGSQLYSTISTTNSKLTHYYSVNDNGVQSANYDNDGATGLNSLAAGVGAVSKKENATAIGFGANASASVGDVALGSGSITSAVVNTTSAMVGSTTYSGFAGTTATSTLSVGDVGTERTITNVAAGRIASSSTDAINGSQLYSTLSTTNKAIEAATTHYYSVNDNGIQLANYDNKGATGLNSMAAGPAASATKQNATALGFNATAGANAGDVALGSDSNTAGVVNTTSAVVGGTTYAGFAGTMATSTVSVGDVGLERTVTNVAAGRITDSSTDAINGSQLYSTISTTNAKLTHYYSVNDNGVQGANYANDGATGLNSMAAGVAASATKENATAIGFGAIAGANLGDVALGSGSVTTGVANTTNAVVGSVTYSGFAGTTATSTLSVGSAGAERTITNVAAGRIADTSTDAINGSQLYSTLSTTNKAIAAATTHYYSVNDDGVISANYKNDGASGVYSLAAGVAASATMKNATAVGYGAAATANEGDIALGSGSITAGIVNTTSAIVGSITYGGFAGTTASSTLSIGALGQERTITNLAAGRISGTSTDAINGSQLYAVAARSVTYDLNPDGTVNYTNLTLNPGGGATTLHNVAEGVADTDAVNVSQLNATVAAAKTKYYSVNSTGGTNENNDGATGADAIASGKNASATTTNAVAIGNGSTATANAGDVALGAGSKTAAVVATTGTTIAGTAYTFAGIAPTSTVSVGDKDAERTITNVAAGQISSTSTDAINGSQLYATNTAINDLSTTVAASKTKYYGVNSTGGSNLNNDGATGTDAIASGKDASAAGVSAVAIGYGATAGSANSVALGAGSTTADVHIGVTAMYGQTAAGIGSNVFGTVSVGTDAAPRQVQNVAAGVISETSRDAINGSQLYTVTVGVSKLGTSAAEALGGGSTYNASTGTVSAPTYQVIGGSVTNVGAALTNVITQGPVQYSTPDGTVTPYTPSNSVTLVGASAGPVALNNVAPGELSATSTQAVNGSQLYATNAYIGAVDNKVNYVDARVTQLDSQNVKYDTNSDGTTNYNSLTLGGGKSDGPVGLHNVANGVAPTDGVNKGQLDGAIGKLDSKLSGGVAAAMAMVNSAPVDPGKSMVTAAMATYNGQTGLGLGWLRRSENGQWIVFGSVSGATGGAKVGVRIGGAFTY
jgi:autotransporter adhesin